MTCSDDISAPQARARVVQQYRSDLWPQHPGLTVGQWLQSWYSAKIAAGTLRPTTARCYRQHLDTYLLPRLGVMRLSRLRGAHITQLYAQIRAEHEEAVASARALQVREDARTAVTGAPAEHVPQPRRVTAASVIRLHATLQAALNAAVRAGEIPANPAKQAEVPHRKPAKVRPWTPQVYGAFLDYLDETRDRMAALFQVAGHTGAAPG